MLERANGDVFLFFTTSNINEAVMNRDGKADRGSRHQRTLFELVCCGLRRRSQSIGHKRLVSLCTQPDIDLMYFFCRSDERSIRIVGSIIGTISELGTYSPRVSPENRLRAIRSKHSLHHTARFSKDIHESVESNGICKCNASHHALQYTKSNTVQYNLSR